MFCSILLPINTEKFFTYKIPDSLSGRIVKGSIVNADFRGKKYYGLVTDIQEKSDIKGVKEIDGLLFDAPADERYFMLIRWISSYYFAPIGSVLRSMLPVRAGYVKRYVCINEGECPEIYIRTQKRPLPMGELSKAAGGAEKAEKMIEDGVLIEDITGYIPPSPRKVNLNADQKSARDAVFEGILNKTGGVSLLMGRPSSGKSEVYIKLAHDVIEKTNGSVLIMLPEIGLAQVVFRRMQHEFGSDRCAIIHSEMSNGERLCYLKGINSGKRRIVVGTRSSVFAPLQSLKLVVIDEEQDMSYKQYDKSPFYNGRDVAVYLGHLFGAQVLLATATPSAETYNNAMKGKYSILRLTERFTESPQPAVRIVRNDSGLMKMPFYFTDEIADTVRNGEQMIFFLNRRGYLNLYSCKKCGEYFKCPDCSVSYSFHKAENEFICHYCGGRKKHDSKCPNCGGELSSGRVWGTEKAENVIRKMFPEIRLERFDIDSTSKKGERKRIIDAMVEQRVDLLIGTQMISKGYDIPNVMSAIIMNADGVINMPDLRSEERFMQMLIQTAGRAGRREKQGRIIVELGGSIPHLESFIESLDYEGYIKSELERRKKLSFPPFTKMLRIAVKDKSEEKCSLRAKSIYRDMVSAKCRGAKVYPPSPGIVEKIGGYYRYEIFAVYIKLKDAETLIKSIKSSPDEYYVDNDTL